MIKKLTGFISRTPVEKPDYYLVFEHRDCSNMYALLDEFGYVNDGIVNRDGEEDPRILKKLKIWDEYGYVRLPKVEVKPYIKACLGYKLSRVPIEVASDNYDLAQATDSSAISKYSKRIEEKRIYQAELESILKNIDSMADHDLFALLEFHNPHLWDYSIEWRNLDPFQRPN